MLKDVKAHATLPVADLARAKAFYIGVLGFDDLETDTDSGAMVNAGGGTRFALFVTPNTQRGGHTQLGFAVDDIEAEYTRMRDRGVEFISEPAPILLGATAIKIVFFRDPDGTLLELVEMAQGGWGH